MAEQVYNGPLDEFTDWTTGINERTNQNVTGGLPPSGKAIRDFLHKTLKRSFIFYEDKESSLYRMFSSTTALNLWLQDKEANADLMLFSFVRPNEYIITADISSNTRYLMSGDNTQTDRILSYKWEVSKSDIAFSDSCTAVYTIVDGNGNVTTVTENYNDTQMNISFDFYRYLTNGDNRVSVTLHATSTGAMQSYAFKVTMLTLELRSTFDYNSKFPAGENINIPYSVYRNVTSVETIIKFSFDGFENSIENVTIGASTAGTTAGGTKLFANNLSEGKHVLQMWAEIIFGAVIYKSNLLYFTFETASTSTTLNGFINVKGSFTGVLYPITAFNVSGTQYEPVNLTWGYYTDNLQTDLSIPVTWKFNNNGVVTDLGTITANNRQQSDTLSFIPTVYTTDNNATLEAYKGNTLILSIPITIAKSDLVIYETKPYALKLSAFGKSNNSETKTTWKDNENNITASFTGVTWEETNGWYNNAFRTIGLGSYAVINYAPFHGNPSLGRTIEVEFETEQVNDETDVVIRIGSVTGGRIDITPNSATLYDAAGNKIIMTNFKYNERIKLAFIINPQSNTVDSNLAYIINNGVLERAGSCAGNIFINETGKVTIGDSKSGIKFYSIRVYNKAISYFDEYNNMVFDSDRKSEIIIKNNVLVESKISYDQCINKIDTFLIKGDLSAILNSATDKDGSLTNCYIERICPYDIKKNFTLENGTIRKHGQSTLNYPITSMKFWTNKGVGNVITKFNCPYQQPLLLGKNRYKMKDTSIPANKFILQANYADSSCVQNGGLQRLIQQTWFNALIDGECKLRTAPQLFSTNTLIHHNNININEDGTVDGYNEFGKQWQDYFTSTFPHEIRNSADSLPCVVFYQDTKVQNSPKTYLGQYVLMEDKKSDFCYGERSIYKADARDPFCLTTPNASGDASINRIWNNKDVLRIEVLQVNSPFSSYLTNTDFTKIQYNSTGLALNYNWENAFELIYPDPDDVVGNAAKGTDKYGPNSDFVKTTQPFVDWYNWVVSTKDNQTKFQAEAAQHLDLYKIAAYYIFVLRFGLVDSSERNIQIKTYDGKHFHFEPWDMDIGIGKKNTGGIAFAPPMDRNTLLPGTSDNYAFSGRTGVKGSQTYSSNWLWDALEAWHEWMDIIVPKVAQALYVAGLTYDNVMNMFDKEYADKWCETLYNDSQYFKYIESGSDANNLPWLQGSGQNYRHWWLSVSMDYYDAKWNCGDFKNHYIYIATDHVAKANAGIDILKLVPTSKTYFTFSRNDVENLGTISATKENPALFDVSKENFAVKAPLYIFGATFIEELDMACLAQGSDGIHLEGAYSATLGAQLKKVNIGCYVAQVDANHYTGEINVKSMSVTSITASGNDALAAIQSLNVRGLQGYISFNEFRSNNRYQLVDVFAMGSGLTAFTSSESGNKYKNLELPGVTTNTSGTKIRSLTTIFLKNSSWENLSFWDAVVTDTNTVTYTKCNVLGDYSINVPVSLRSLTMLGTTCSHENSKTLILNWIKCLKANNIDLGTCVLNLSGIVWDNNTCETLLTYEELSDIAKFNNGVNNVPNSDGTYNISGYLVLDSTNGSMTSQQLAKIKSWFGETVFQKNSAGLVVDQVLNYMAITVGGDVDTSNGEISLYEGHRANLSATKFVLGETNNNKYNWSVRAPGTTGTGTSYKSIYLQTGEDGITYLYADESSYGNYQAEIVCSSLEDSTTANLLINIKSVTYPTSYKFNCDSFSVRQSDDDTWTFPQESVSGEFYITTVGAYTATVKSVTFRILDMDDNVILDNIDSTALKNGGNGAIAMDDYLYYIANALKTYGIPLYSGIVSDTLRSYTLEATVTFKSNVKRTATAYINTLNDMSPIVRNDGSALYSVISQKCVEFYGGTAKGNYYKSDLFALTGVINFSTRTDITSLIALDGKTIFEYLPKISSVYLDGCTNLPSKQLVNTVPVSQLVFNKIPFLDTLSLENCAALTDDINLISNDIKYLYMNGTFISPLLPVCSKLLVLALGTPKVLNLDSPTQLYPFNVTIDSSSSLTSLIVKNMPASSDIPNTFTTFIKILG